LKQVLLHLPVIGNYIRQRDAVTVPGTLWAPPGHFYSPIPSPQDINEGTRLPVLDRTRPALGIDYNLDAQKKLVERLSVVYEGIPFGPTSQEGLRYYFENDFYGYADGVILYCMMRHFEPKRIIEVGSGFSSALILDTNERFFDSSIQVTCVEPYPDQLKNLANPDETNLRIIEKRVQDVALSEFENLESDDFLFIDSSHVSKVNSDVNYLFFEVIPRLKPGVLIHIHDVFAGFEYPREWLDEGRAWNEQYLLRALLMGNSKLEVLIMTDHLQSNYPELVKANLPLAMQNRGGSIWLHVAE